METITELSGGSFYLELTERGTKVRLHTDVGVFDIVSDTSGAEAPLVIEEVSAPSLPIERG